jgi:hypothetical protein
LLPVGVCTQAGVRPAAHRQVGACVIDWLSACSPFCICLLCATAGMCGTQVASRPLPAMPAIRAGATLRAAGHMRLLRRVSQAPGCMGAWAVVLCQRCMLDGPARMLGSGKRVFHPARADMQATWCGPGQLQAAHLHACVAHAFLAPPGWAHH